MSTHEPLTHSDAIEPGSDRGFGLVVGAVLVAIAAYQFYRSSPLYPWFLFPGSLLIVLGLLAPSVLRPLNVLWTKLGVLLGKIVTPVVMFLVYIVSVVPIGIILRVLGKDLLKLKSDEDASSYWITREPAGPTPESLKDQF